MEVERTSEASSSSSNQVVPDQILETRIKSVEVPRKQLPDAPIPSPPVSEASGNKSVEKERTKEKEAVGTVPMEAVQEDDSMNAMTGELRYATEGTLFVLVDNKGVIYHGDDVRPPKVEAEPDDFFEITQKDVESIYRELRAKRAQLENQPLLTSSLRKTDQELMEEQVVNKYPVTVVRIRFPDRFVLQGVFPTADYVSSVMAFVQRHLQDPGLNFYLFKAPPKTLLDGDKTLLQENLLGLAIIYFGSDTKLERYFKEELYSKVSDPQEVFKNSRSLAEYSGPQHQTPRDGGAEMVERREPVETVSKSAQEPKADGQPTAGASRPTRTTNSGVVPKWFKVSK
jgi:tether containing UBX domain for GLUT4